MSPRLKYFTVFLLRFLPYIPSLKKKNPSPHPVFNVAPHSPSVLPHIHFTVSLSVSLNSPFSCFKINSSFPRLLTWPGDTCTSFDHFHQGAVVKFWQLNFDPWKFNIEDLLSPLQHLGLDRESCLQILYTESLLPDDARWWPQAGDKIVWLIPSRLHHVAWQSAERLLMLRESKSSYLKSHCKPLSSKIWLSCY